MIGRSIGSFARRHPAIALTPVALAGFAAAHPFRETSRAVQAELLGTPDASRTVLSSTLNTAFMGQRDMSRFRSLQDPNGFKSRPGNAPGEMVFGLWNMRAG